METNKTRQDRGGNRMKACAETLKRCFRVFLGWFKRDKQGDLVYTNIMRELVTSPCLFPVDQCYCVQMKIVLSLRQADQLGSKLLN
ncbi:hypothetical protein D623_10028850 [Myotis brandtii]|uniref:Uncharacterized protein n=1 Tax=Myotis brandtii TaxID=109478 RepID=S7N9N7_MYOBR|nr:hypothetical protein D623_10028850 [Myotis brandtii]